MACQPGHSNETLMAQYPAGESINMIESSMLNEMAASEMAAARKAGIGWLCGRNNQIAWPAIILRLNMQYGWR